MSGRWRIERHGEVASTNTLARERIAQAWAAGAEAQGLAIVAQRQRAGRGQHGRSWASPAGGLYLSAIVETVPADARDKLALVAGAAVVAALDGLGVQAGLRWPNDVMVAGRKVGGILCEALAEGNRWAAVLGIGVNAATAAEDLPPELRRSAGTLRGRLGGDDVLDRVEDAVLRQVAETLDDVRERGMAGVLARVRAVDVLRGRRVELDEGGERVTGTAAGIDEQGALVVATGPSGARSCRGTVMAVDGTAVRG